MVMTQTCFSCMSLKNDLGLLVKNKSIVDLSLQGWKGRRKYPKSRRNLAYVTFLNYNLTGGWCVLFSKKGSVCECLKNYLIQK